MKSLVFTLEVPQQNLNISSTRLAQRKLPFLDALEVPQHNLNITSTQPQHTLNAPRPALAVVFSIFEAMLRFRDSGLL